MCFKNLLALNFLINSFPKSLLLRTVNNKTVISFGFCDIQNNQGLGKSYQPKPKGEAHKPYLDLDYSRYHKIFIQ